MIGDYADAFVFENILMGIYVVQACADGGDTAGLGYQANRDDYIFEKFHKFVSGKLIVF